MMAWPSFLKNMALLPRSFGLRRIISLMVFVLIGALCDQQYSAAHGLWVTLTGVVILQAKPRLSLRLVLVHFCLMVVGIAFLTLVLSPQLLYVREHDVVLGGLLALAVYGLFFPARTDVDFRSAVVVLLQAEVRYLVAIQSILQQKRLEADGERRALEALQCDVMVYPEWVYAPGFNPNMEAGHQHFLLGVERVTHILYGMESAAREIQETSCFLPTLDEPVQRCILATEKMLLSLARILAEEKITHPNYELEESIQGLEQALRLSLGVPNTLLDRSSEYLPWYALIYGFKDMQQVLSTLVQALR